MPSRKITSSVLAGAFASLVVWVVDVFIGIKIPAEQAVALSTILSFIVAYFVKDAE